MSSEDVMWKQAAEQIARLQAENARLRAALQPFADAVNDEDVLPKDNEDLLYIERQHGRYFAIAPIDRDLLTVGHLRAAAKALENE